MCDERYNYVTKTESGGTIYWITSDALIRDIYILCHDLIIIALAVQAKNGNALLHINAQANIQ